MIQYSVDTLTLRLIYLLITDLDGYQLPWIIIKKLYSRPSKKIMKLLKGTYLSKKRKVNDN